MSEVSMLLFDDFRGKITPTMFISDAKEKMAKRKAVAEKLPEVLDRLVSYLEASKYAGPTGELFRGIFDTVSFMSRALRA